MKKTFKKLMAALLAVALLCAMAVPAFADTVKNNDNGTITIHSAVANEEYKIYQMFVLNQFDTTDDSKNYTYTVVPAWADFFNKGGDGATYISLNNGHPTWIHANSDEDTAGEFAKKAAAWAKKQNITPTKTATADATGTVTFTDLNLGYYLVDTSLGALCNLTTTATDATISEKNETPNLEKKVKEGTSYSETSNAKIGETVEYEVTITVQKGADHYVLTDTMSAGLTFDPSSVTVTIADNNVASKNYTLDSNPKDGSTFILTFDDTFIAGLAKDTKIKINYNATLNKDAVYTDAGNTNNATLKYGNEQTVNKQTKTLSYQFDLIKVDGTTNKLLAGAKFKLYTEKTGGSVINLVKESDGSYRVAQTSETAVDYIETTATAPIRIKGLDNTTYYLEEAVAPQGYNKLTDRAEVNLNKGSNTTKMTDDTWTNGVQGGVKVENNAGATLPSTGGMGTTLFYVIGGGLMVAAVVLLVTKKRMENK